ncbi:hypothetical protein ID866_3427 [Astraeus odoratus]|nr:hypothetical protein ID866_3427 [Astraeus odoratus]
MLGEEISDLYEVEEHQQDVSESSHWTKKNTVLRSHGRPPWYCLSDQSGYGEDGLPISDAFVIGIAGGSASGKTHVARQLVKSLGSVPTIVIMSQDSFYKRHTEDEIVLAHANRFDFDHPDAIDMPMFAACLADLKACRQTNIPIYSFKEHQRLPETKYLYGAAVVIAEGIMTLHDPSLRALYDLKIFVQCDSDLMLARRISRDVKERGRSVEGVLEQYLRYVKPAFDNFVHPTARYADIGIYTILRDEKSSRQDFIFFVDRLATLLIEKAMDLLPHRPKVVTTPIDTECHGKELDIKNICGVSILRSGGPLEKGLQRVLSDVTIGSLLVQTDAKTGEPLLLHVMLPKCIRERHLAIDTWVFLLDAQISTGASAFMAIRTLLDHGVQQDHIVFVTFLVARTGGIHVLQRAFPKVKIICGAIDPGLREAWIEEYQSEGEGQDGNGRNVWIVEPGIGQIGMGLRKLVLALGSDEVLR